MRFRQFVADMADRIATGALAPGTRLPPQRDFAYRNGIAYSTAARIYAELTRMGLVTGEVGRGTFVRDGTVRASALAEPRPERVDLEYNFPLVAAQQAAIAETLRAAFTNPDAAMRPSGIEGFAEMRGHASSYLARGDWLPEPRCILFSGNGRQAIAAALAALAKPGDRVGAEPLTYAVTKGIAARLGIELTVIPVDEQGMIPAELQRVARRSGLRALYVQPSFQNPLGLFMGRRRRQAIADVIVELGLPIVEDAIYSFLGDETPIAAFAPDHTILVDSLSKRVAPGLGLGFIVAAPAMLSAVAQALRTGPWAPAGLASAFGEAWLRRPDLHSFDEIKRRDATQRQSIARRALGPLAAHGDDRAYHLYVDLPAPWRAEDFAAAASRRGIAVTPAGNFAIQPGHAPPAIRIALSSPPPALLEEALRTLSEIALAGPDLLRSD